MWHEKTKAFTSVHPPTARWKVQRAGYQWDQTGVSHAARLLFMSLLIIPTEKANKFVKYVNCLLGPSEDGRASSAGGKKKYLVLRTQYVHWMHQSIKVDQRKPTAQMILLWAVRTNQGAAKKRKFWINIWQLTLCSSCKLSSINFPSILPTENIFTVPFHRGYKRKKWLKLLPHY